MEYNVNVARNFENGELSAYPDPPAPTDLGTPLTQDQIDSLKIFLNDLMNRFP